MKKIITGLFLVSWMTSCTIKMVTFETHGGTQPVYTQPQIDTLPSLIEPLTVQSQCNCCQCMDNRRYRNFNGPAPNMLGHCTGCHKDTIRTYSLMPLIDTKLVIKKPIVKKPKPRTTVHKKPCTCPLCHKKH